MHETDSHLSENQEKYMFSFVDEIEYIRGGRFKEWIPWHKGNSGGENRHDNVLRGYKNAIIPMLLHTIKIGT